MKKFNMQSIEDYELGSVAYEFTALLKKINFYGVAPVANLLLDGMSKDDVKILIKILSEDINGDYVRE